MPQAFRSFMLAGILWIQMTAGSFCRNSFAIFNRGLAATFGMNVKTMLARR
ncbi:Uncharacterised protein [Salmonella enterica subsp. arizonae]|uniref:Uncharacterized protein n=1 Tax=Salmonella enterica subsp. arizonae TaxID=59203 RepID=A0A379S7M3_SALER|nr:Uncharacterised protein [Salmonella enterica subsp. arizonae]